MVGGICGCVGGCCGVVGGVCCWYVGCGLVLLLFFIGVYKLGEFDIFLRIVVLGIVWYCILLEFGIVYIGR